MRDRGTSGRSGGVGRGGGLPSTSMELRAAAVTIALALTGCLPDIGAYEVIRAEGDGGTRQPGGQLPPPQDCSAPIPIGQGYAEGFEEGANGWGAYADMGTSSWEVGPPRSMLFASRGEGGQVIATGLGIDYGANEESFLVSPCFDASASSDDLLLTFARAYDTEERYDLVRVELSVDGGETWERVLGESRLGWESGQPFNGMGEWETAAVLLENTAGQPRVRLRFGLDSDSSQQGEGFAIDDVTLRTATEDLALTIEEADRCGYVDATVTNVGGLPVTGFEVIADVDGVMDVTSFDSTIGYLQERELMLGEDLAGVLNAQVVTPGDADGANDAVSFTFQSMPIGAGYSSGFETDGGMLEVVGDNPSWEVGVPAGELITTAGGGTRAWVTNLDGPYNSGEDASLRMPCMDMSALVDDPTISLSRVFRTEERYDYGVIEMSIDGGSFSRVGSSSSADGVNWYTSYDGWDGSSGAGAWQTASHPLRNAAGHQAVRIRIRFHSDGSREFDGFGIDDLAITP